MKWYAKTAKRIGKGIVQFLLPIIILLFIFEKATSLVQSIILPLKSHLPSQKIFGIGMFTLISIFLILVICFLAGLLYETKPVKSFLSFLEDNLLIFIPGYAMIKSSADASIGDTGNDWKVVMIKEDDCRVYAIEVDKRPDGSSMIFFPEPPDAKSGELKLMSESNFLRINYPVNKLIKNIRNYGHGSSEIPK